MTISDKIRIYELSRDLNLENKDILDAAQKLSISVKSHSSSISKEEANKIKNLINKKNADKKILSINKPSIKEENYRQNKQDKSPVNSSVKGKTLKDNSNKNPLLIKPLNKPENLKNISNQAKNPNKPTIINSSKSQPNLTNQKNNSKPSQNFNPDKRTFINNITPPLKSPAKTPIQLIAKPKNINNNAKSNNPSQKIYNSGEKKQLLNKPEQNTNNPKTKNFNPPELVGAPIRRKNLNTQSNKQNNNKQNISLKQTFPSRTGAPNRPGIPSRPGSRNKPLEQVRPGSFNRQVNPNRAGTPNRPGMPNRPGSRNKPLEQVRPGSFNKQVNPNRAGTPNRPGMPNRPGSKINGQNTSGIRRIVSPNELLQLQKSNKSEKDKLVTKK